MNINPNKNHRILVIDDNKQSTRTFANSMQSKAGANGLADARPPCSATRRHRSICPNSRLIRRFRERKVRPGSKKSLQEGHPLRDGVVDVRMPPGWDGVETTAKIWKISRLQVVICTAYSDYSWEDMLKKLGYSDRLVILKKPFDTSKSCNCDFHDGKMAALPAAKLRLDDLEEMVQERTSALQKTNADWLPPTSF